MIELTDGFWVMENDIKAVKHVSAKKCAVWLTGQSATENFVVDCPAEDVLELLGYFPDQEGEHDDSDE